MTLRTCLIILALAIPTDVLANPKPGMSIAAATQAGRVAPRDAGWRGAMQVFSYEPGRLYQVHAAVGRVTDIMLQEGEALSDSGAVAAGDTVRWVIGEAASGTGTRRRIHILVKPTDPNLATNLVINTDRRTYHVELRSTANAFLAGAAWSYPQDELIALEARADALQREARTAVQTGIDPQRLNFAYSLKGDSPPWRPTHVFDDGGRTYIVFPETIGQSELPPLFLIGEKGAAELVNYRVSGRFLIVDRLFAKADLRLGTKRPQIVRIERSRGRDR